MGPILSTILPNGKFSWKVNFAVCHVFSSTSEIDSLKNCITSIVISSNNNCAQNPTKRAKEIFILCGQALDIM